MIKLSSVPRLFSCGFLVENWFYASVNVSARVDVIRIERSQDEERKTQDADTLYTSRCMKSFVTIYFRFQRTCIELDETPESKLLDRYS